MAKSSQFLPISSLLCGLALGSMSVVLAIHLDPSPAKAIPVSLPKPKTVTPVTKKSSKLVGASVANTSVSTNKK